MTNEACHVPSPNPKKPRPIMMRGSILVLRRPEIGAVINMTMPEMNIVLPIISAE